MELFCQEEVCQIVKEFVKKYMEWEGYPTEVTEKIWKNFIKDEENQRIKFKRLIKVEEINVKDLDDNRTA